VVSVPPHTACERDLIHEVRVENPERPKSALGPYTEGKVFSQRIVHLLIHQAHCSALRRGIQKIKPTLLWLVVNGENIEIFTDRWIPQMSKPIAKPLDFLITISRVYQLISSNMGKWDEELIRDCFNNATATSILHTPIN